MAWTTKGCGKAYNSNCGYSRVIEGNTGLVILSVVYQQKCRTCDTWEQKGKPACPHTCVKNYTGFSKGMESAAIVEMATQAPQKGFVIAIVVSSNDSTMRAQMTQAGPDNPKGKLTPWIFAPSFLADPSHRNKVVSSIFFPCLCKCVNFARYGRHGKEVKKIDGQ